MTSKNAITETVQFKKPLGVASKKPLKSRSKTQQQQPFSAQQKERVIKLLLQQSSPSPSPLAPSLSNNTSSTLPSSSTTSSSSSSTAAAGGGGGGAASSTPLTNLQPLSAGSGSLWNAQNSQNAIPSKFSFVNFVEVSSHDPIHSINEEIECRTKQMQELTNTIYFATLQYYCDFLVHLRNRLHVFTTMTKANAVRFDSPTTTLTQFSQESLYLIPSANTQAKHLAISFIDSSFQSLSGYIHSIIHSSFSAAAHSILLRLVSDASSELASRPPSPSSSSSSSSSSSEPVPLAQ